MKNRLKNIILCTLIFSKGKLVVLGIIELFMLLAMIVIRFLQQGTEVYDSVIYGNDFPIVVMLFVYGLAFYESHLALCKQNAVSDKYRMLSQLIIGGGLCSILAVLDSVTRRFIPLGADFSLAELIRISVDGGFYVTSNIFLTVIESFAMYFMVLSLGLVISSIRERIGSGATLIAMLLVAFACMFGLVSGQFTWINPVAWMFGLVPAFMMQKVYLAVVFYVFVGLGANLVAYSIGLGNKKLKARGV